MRGTAILALGSNVGDCIGNLRRAKSLLSERFPILGCAGVYKTPPAFYLDQPDFYNSALAVSAEVEPLDLLDICKQVEKEMGRVPSFRNAPRPIDVDIIFYEGGDCISQRLVIPHAGWSERDFVLAPLLDLLDDGLISCANFPEAERILRTKRRAYKKICTL